MTEQNLTNQEPTTPEAPAATTDTPPEEPKAGMKQFTQAELDAIVTARLARASKQREEAEAKTKEKAEAEALKKNAEWQKLAEQRESELTQAQDKLKQVQLLELKRAAAAEYDLPKALIPRLQGETEEEIKADAEKLSAELPKPKPQPKISTTNPGGSQTGESEQERRRRLGI